jgi:hypothetical protein
VRSGECGVRNGGRGFVRLHGGGMFQCWLEAASNFGRERLSVFSRVPAQRSHGAIAEGIVA